ncbi:hypothetical protein BDV93DRAFT_576430 [Ceratobasidium sp. AG-I]|nr:hypothetical protein BDV93DRAFT_576430 [Ceratobasidium sp. AG-I]
MNLPTDDEERHELVFRPLLPVLNYQYLSPPLLSSIDSTPQIPPTAFNSASHIISQATTFSPIRPFRDTTYFNGPGEHLSSQVYTLNADNMWELNLDRTHALQSTAQSSSPPQFATYVPVDHWNPHQWTHSSGGYVRPLQSPSQPQPQIIPVPSVSMDQLYRLPHNEPVNPNIPRHSPNSPVNPSAAGSSDHRNNLGSGSTATAATTKRGGRRPGDSISSDTSEKKFKCEACGKSYSRKAELDRHQRTNKKHNGIGKFSCECCGRWFTRDDARLRHERRHAAGEGSRRSSSSSGSVKGKEGDMDVDINDEEEEGWGIGG